MKNCLLPFLLLIPLFSCDPKSSFLEVRNSSAYSFYFQLSCLDTLNLIPMLQVEEVIIKGRDTLHVKPDYFVEQNGSTRVALHGDWLQFAEQCSDKSIKFFFIQEFHLKNFEWDYIVKHQLYSKKIEVTSQDLIKNRFVIEFLNEN